MSSALTDADQDAGLREALIACLAERFFREPGQCGGHADALINGPLATLRARATAAEDKLRDREAEIERLTGETYMLREVQEAVIARWRDAALLAVNGDVKRLQRLLMASQSRITGSALASTEHHASSEEATDAQ